MFSFDLFACTREINQEEFSVRPPIIYITEKTENGKNGKRVVVIASTDTK